jgi:uncharacterized protein
MTLRRYLCTLFLLAITVSLATGCGASPGSSKNNPDSNKNDTTPNTRTDSSTKQPSRSHHQSFWDSLPKPTGYVNDYENIFTDAEEQSLDSLIRDFEKRTTIQITVVTFDTAMTTRDSLDALTLRIAIAWGVGQKGKDNGMVIGISRGYRQMRIQNGYGIEHILSDEETKLVIANEFIPLYRESKYFEGTLAGLKALMTILGDRYK